MVLYGIVYLNAKLRIEGDNSMTGFETICLLIFAGFLLYAIFQSIKLKALTIKLFVSFLCIGLGVLLSQLWYIGLLIIIVDIAFLMKQGNKNAKDFEQQQVERRKSQKIDSEDFLIHIAGHPTLKQDERILFQIREKNKIYLAKYLEQGLEPIRPQDILSCELKTEEEIRKDVTFTRLVALGIFAFALKKETKEIKTYMIFSYKLQGTPVTCIFKSSHEGQNLSNIVFKANSIKTEYQNNIKIKSETPLNTNSGKESITEQIRELAKLRNDGILSEQEFEDKKKSLLDKI